MTDNLTATTTSLFQTERQQMILEQLARNGRVEVAELSGRFQVTTETIRRDLSELQKQRRVRRVHGGAVAWEANAFEPLVSVRNDLQDSEKRRLALAAVAELPDSGSVIIDSGSTLTRFAEAIPDGIALRVVTNSLPIAQTLSEREHIELIVAGGLMRRNTLAMVDGQAIRTIESLRVDTLFISSDGLSAENGLSTPYPEEAQLKRAMIASARRVVALVDHSKFGKEHFMRFARWSDIDTLVTNAEVDSGPVAAIEAMGTTVVLA